MAYRVSENNARHSSTSPSEVVCEKSIRRADVTNDAEVYATLAHRTHLALVSARAALRY